MQTSLAFHATPVRPPAIGGSRGPGRLPRLAAASARGRPAPARATALQPARRGTPEAARRAPSDDGGIGASGKSGLVVLQVIREGTGLAGLALWGWACLRLLGAG